MKPPKILVQGDVWLDTLAPFFGSTLGDALTVQWTYRDTLREFLALHDIDIEDVYSIHFNELDMYVYRYDKNSIGKRYARNGRLSVKPAVNIKYKISLDIFD